jgi:Flp pilus assembly protein TadG
MLKALSRNLRRYLRHELGVAAVIFAIMLPAIVASAGVAVDLAVAYNSQNRLANALDKATLAAASSTSLDSADLQTRFLAFFNANYPAGKYGTPINPTLTVNGTTMSATASATVPTSFMNIFGVSSLTINAASTVVETLAGVEAVLVLDTTGSMAGNNIAALKMASTDFINIMFSSITDPKYLKIGIVPWAETVNVGPYGIGKNLDGSTFETGTTFITWPANFPTSFPTHTDPYVSPASSIVYGTGNTDWGGCVMEPNAAAIEEDDPTLMWPMYRYQHTSPNYTPTTCTSYNCLAYNCEAYNCETYECKSCSRGSPNTTGGCSNGGTCQTAGSSSNGATCGVAGTSSNGASCKTAGTSSNGASCKTQGSTCLGWSYGDLPNEDCTTVPVLPMTSNQNALLAEINALPTAYSTYPDIGMVWGWRMISPGFPFTEGASYSDPTWSKTVIMMTDGNATTASVASGEGFAGTTGISQSATDENNKFAQICTNMKAQGIRVYTITFQSAINSTTMGYYQDCATNPSMYFNAPTNADLTTAFQAIATQLGQLHLTQ